MEYFITILLFVAVSALPRPPSSPPVQEEAGPIVFQHWDSINSIKDTDLNILEPILFQLTNSSKAHESIVENKDRIPTDILNAIKDIHKIFNSKYDDDGDDDGDSSEDDDKESKSVSPINNRAGNEPEPISPPNDRFDVSPEPATPKYFKSNDGSEPIIPIYDGPIVSPGPVLTTSDEINDDIEVVPPMNDELVEDQDYNDAIDPAVELPDRRRFVDFMPRPLQLVPYPLQ